MLNEEIIEAHTQLEMIKLKLLHGGDYDALKEEAYPYLAVLNKKGDDVAKKYKKRYHPITFTGYMR